MNKFEFNFEYDKIYHAILEYNESVQYYNFFIDNNLLHRTKIIRENYDKIILYKYNEAYWLSVYALRYLQDFNQDLYYKCRWDKYRCINNDKPNI